MLTTSLQACCYSVLLPWRMDLLSDRIAHILVKTGLTASGLARAIGCSPAAVSQYLSGETKNVKNELLFAMADVTGFEARWIGTGKGPEKTPEKDEKTKRLVEIYAELDARGKDSVFRVAETEYEYAVVGDKKTA